MIEKQVLNFANVHTTISQQNLDYIMKEQEREAVWNTQNIENKISYKHILIGIHKYADR